MRRFLAAFCAASALGVLTPGTARAESFRAICHVRDDAVSVNCPTANRGGLVHMAWIYDGLFRDPATRKDLKPGDGLSCGVNAKDDLTDCIALVKK